MHKYSTSKIPKVVKTGTLKTSFMTLVGVLLTTLMRIHYKRIDLKRNNIYNIILLSFTFALIAGIIHFSLLPLAYIAAGLKVKLALYFSPERFLRGTSYYMPIYFGWSILYFSIKLWLERENQRKIAEKASALVQNTQFQMLRYHLNPHFLFNALNSIRALIDEDTISSRKLITELSEYLRYSLVSRNKPSVSVKEELEAIDHYLSVEKQRYEEKLFIRYDIDKNSKDLQIPSFVIQPLIENAIKFGMKTSKMPLEILVKTELNETFFIISVINSGNWVENPAANNDYEHGIDTVTARMRNFFSENFVLDRYEKDNYVHVTLRITLN